MDREKRRARKRHFSLVYQFELRTITIKRLEREKRVGERGGDRDRDRDRESKKSRQNRKERKF